jgi:hypothetical protein
MDGDVARGLFLIYVITSLSYGRHRAQGLRRVRVSRYAG